MWAETPRQVAEVCEVVLSSLPGPPEVEEVVYGRNGLMAAWKQGDVYVDITTNLPTTIRRIAADAKVKGVSVLDAPVSGATRGPDAARAGTLTIMVGGEVQVLEKVRKVLEAIGDKIFHVGDVGSGNVVKLVNNVMSFTCNAITAECMVLGVKAGVDVKKLHEVIKVSSGNNTWLEHGYPRRVFRGDFDSGFRIDLALKDLGLGLTLAKQLGVIMPVAATVEQRFLEAKAAGLGDKGTASIVLRLEQLAGVQVRSAG